MHVHTLHAGLPVQVALDVGLIRHHVPAAILRQGVSGFLVCVVGVLWDTSRRVQVLPHQLL